MTSAVASTKRNETSALKTILVLDDNSDSLNVFYWVLEPYYNVLKTETADEAISLCYEHKEIICLLVADIVLRSAVSGIQVGLRVRESCPNIPILLTSGTPIEGWREHDLAQLKTLMSGRIDFLQKPFTVQMLICKVENLLNGAFSTSEIERLFEEVEVHRRGLD